MLFTLNQSLVVRQKQVTITLYPNFIGSRQDASFTALIKNLLTENAWISDEKLFPNLTACPPIDCIDGLIFDVIACRCVPKHDPECPPRFIYDSLLCRCVCDFEKVDCPDGFEWDENQCKCACPNSEICKPGFIWSEQECKCSCNIEKECRKNFIFDQQTCDCVCDPKIQDAGCPNGTVFDHTICHCVLGAIPSCLPGYKYDELSCDCVCEKIIKCREFEIWDEDTCKCIPIKNTDGISK